MKRIGFFILLMWLVLGRVFGQDRIDWDQIKAAPGSNYIPRSNVSGDGVWTAINAILSGANSVYGTGSPGYIAEWLNDSTLTFDATGAYQLSVGTDAQRPTGASGLIRYSTTSGNLEWYNASDWEKPVLSSTAAGTFTAGSVLFADANGRAAQDNARFKWVDASDYLTVQDAAQAVRIGETWTGTGGTEAVFIGYRAGYNASNATYNIGIGTNALRVSSGPYNVALGYASQYNNGAGQYNVSFGFESLYSNTNGNNNFAIGTSSLRTLNGGSFNVANGTSAMVNLTNGSYNASLGFRSGQSITTGNYNIMIGYQTSYSASTNGIKGGGYNILVGAEAGQESTQAAGAYSIGIGYQALSSASAMTNNIAIGRGAGVSNSNTTVMLLGYGATATANDQITIGSANYTTARFPITGAVQVASGTTAQRPTAVVGQFRNNTDSTNAEYYANGAWRQIASRDWARSTFALAAAGYTGWTLAGDSGTQSIASGNTATFTGGWGIVTAASATDVLTVTADSSEVATQYDITQGVLGFIDGSGAIDRIPFFSDANTLTSDASLTYDGSSTITIDDGSYSGEYSNYSIAISDAGTAYDLYADPYQIYSLWDDSGVSAMRKGSGYLSGAIGTNQLNGVSSSRYNQAGTDAPLIFGIVGASDDGVNSVGGELALRSSRTTSATTHGVTQSGDLLGRITAWGNYDQTGASMSWTGKAFTSKIEFRATETYSSTARGSKIVFSTTDNTTTTVDDRLTIDQNGDLTAHAYDDTKRDSAAHLMAIHEATGKLVPLAQVNAKYMEDTDVTLSEAEVYKFQEVRVWMSTTAGASSQTELTIPDAAAAYVNTKLVITSKDASGTYNNLVNTPGSTIYEAGSDTPSIVVQAGETVVLWGIRTGASTYRWAVQKN